MRTSYLQKALQLLAILLTTSFIGHAQEAEIHIGDRCPDKLSTTIDRLVSASAYKENLNKPVLIDFWATWCSPCVAALPKLDSLQKTYADQFTIFSVAERSDTRVAEVLKRIFNKKTPSLTFIAEADLIKSYFPHQTIPHYVWIGRDKRVKVITADVTAIITNISRLLTDENITSIITKQKTVSTDGTKPLYAAKQISLKDELLYHSMITSWREDLDSRAARGDNFINVVNLSTLWMFQIAYGKFDMKYLDPNRLELIGFQTKLDSADIGMFSTDTLKKLWRQKKEDRLYTYELSVPANKYTPAQLFEMMQQDVGRFFLTKGISGRLEKRTKKVLALISINKGPIPAFAAVNEKAGHYSGKNFLKVVNQPMQFFLNQLTASLGNKTPPIVNKTGYDNVVNIELTDTTNLHAINKELAAYSLTLTETNAEIDILVIKKSS